MKSVIQGIFTMASAVACLCLVLNRPVCADEQAKSEQHNAVIIQLVGSEDLQPGTEGVSHDKHAQAIRIIAQKKAEAETQLKKAKQEIARSQKRLAEKARHVADARQKAAQVKKVIAITVHAKGEEDSAQNTAKSATQTFSVKIENGQILLNGKPLADVGDVGRREVRVVVLGDSEKTLKPSAKKEAVELDVDADIQVEDVIVEHDGRAHAADERGHSKDLDRPQVRRVRVGVDKSAPARAMRLIRPEVPVAKVPADVAKRLKSIESELQKIRKLLEQMQQDNQRDEKEDQGQG